MFSHWRDDCISCQHSAAFSTFSFETSFVYLLPLTLLSSVHSSQYHIMSNAGIFKTKACKLRMKYIVAEMLMLVLNCRKSMDRVQEQKVC